MQRQPSLSFDGTTDVQRQAVEKIVGHVAHLLPAQGPIGVFIHHNTLHAFQHLPFEKAVREASDLFRTEPYMTEDAFREQLAKGRIRQEDIEAVLSAEEDSEVIVGRLSRRALRRAMLAPGVRSFHPETILWQLEEGDLLRRFREDLSTDARASLGSTDAESVQALFLACRERVPVNQRSDVTLPVRPHDGILALNGRNLDDVVHPVLIRLAGAFVDQGMAYWPMPHREEGFLKASRDVLLQAGAVLPPALNLLPVILRWHEVAAMDATAVVADILNALGVPGSEWEATIQAELLALPGWAGMMRRLEEEPELAPFDRLSASLMDFLAVRLCLTMAATIGLAGSRKNWRVPVLPNSPGPKALVDTAILFDVAQLIGFPPATIRSLSTRQFTRLWQEVEEFSQVERRRVLHLAYERRHERQILLPMLEYARRPESAARPQPAAQVFFCIDEREESIRRQLEEIDPEIETLGAAGFFGAAMQYTALDEPHGVALCPVVVKPAHAIHERPVAEHRYLHAKRQRLRRAWAKLARHSYLSTRTLVRGWASTTVLGILCVFPLAARVLAPRRYGRLIAWLNDAFLPEPRTELTYMRTGEAGHHAAEGLLVGFTLEEKADRVASVLGPAGLRTSFSRLVAILGHGSTSLNNPHESAHDCGACGGRRGGPNGRIFAMMANHPGVRQALKARGIAIPDGTWFVGGYHDTCDDRIELYDLDLVPQSHQDILARLRKSLDRARALDAHERSRRFEAAPSGKNAVAALHHVEARAEHLAQPRPEYGHCTNAVCFVGRRGTTRGLFLDRRAFLVSYDPTQDPDDGNLGRLLGAVIPVCGGISLEYYFSFVDNERYGCGTKLPHNVTGLVGVMNGYQSDLRTGLPLQMVEIHEPVRILFVLESTPDRALATIRKNALLNEFLENRWIRLATLDPSDRRMHVYRGDGKFEQVEGNDETLGSATSSVDWYSGKLEHLPLVSIGARPSA